MIYPSRVFLVLTNILFMLLSIVGVLLGLLAFSGTVTVGNRKDTAIYSITGHVICVTSAFCFVVSVCGCLGSLFNFRAVLCTYIIILTVLVMTGVFGMVYLHMKDGNGQSYLERALEAAFRQYNETEDLLHPPSTTRTVSDVLECCGLEGPEDFLNGRIYWHRDALREEVWHNPLPYACRKTSSVEKVDVDTREKDDARNATYTTGCLEAAEFIVAYLREFLIYLFICCSLLETVLIWLASKQCLRENLDNIFEQVHVRQVPVRGKRDVKKIVQGASGDRARRGAIDLGMPIHAEKADSVTREVPIGLFSSHMNLAVAEVRAQGAPLSPARPKGITALVGAISPTAASTWTKLRYFGNVNKAGSQTRSLSQITLPGSRSLGTLEDNEETAEAAGRRHSRGARGSDLSLTSINSIISDASEYLQSVVDTVFERSESSDDNVSTNTGRDAKAVKKVSKKDRQDKRSKSLSIVLFSNLESKSESSILLTAENMSVGGLSNQTSQISGEARSAEFKSTRPLETLNTEQHVAQHTMQSSSKTPSAAALETSWLFRNSESVAKDDGLVSLWTLLWPWWCEERTERPPRPIPPTPPSPPVPCWRLAMAETPSHPVQAAAAAPPSPPVPCWRLTTTTSTEMPSRPVQASALTPSSPQPSPPSSK